MTLLGMILTFATMLGWIFIGQLIINHLTDDKRYNISRFWEWNPLWFLGLFEWFDTDKNP